MDQSSDDEEAVWPHTPSGYINSPNGRRLHDIFDDSDIGSDNDAESDTESDTGESDTDSDASNDSKENDYDVLDWILDDVDENLDNAERQKQFRKQFAEYIVWVHKFQKQPIYKKVMHTVKELRDGAQGYELPEAVFKAVKDRKYLINDILNKMDEDEENDDTDTENSGNESDSEEDNVSYSTVKEFPSVYS